MKFLEKKILLLLLLTGVLALAVFLFENVLADSQLIVTRNTYGEGERRETYEVTIEDQVEDAEIEIEIQEREYAPGEVDDLFQKVMKELDTIILGENTGLDRIETDLHLVTELEGYPVQIQWELSSYDVMNPEGKIQEEEIPEEGTLVELRGTISYGQEKAVYVRNAMVYPVTREGVDKLLYEVRQALLAREENTRQDANFTLPEELGGRKLIWSRKKEQHWYYVVLIGVVLSAFLVYREAEKAKQKEKQRQEELILAYPGMISKFTMLLSTGTTVKHAWEKIVHNYEEQHTRENPAYQEMKTTLHEMQGGVPEAEAYERFGKRCNITIFIKFGALLSQNLRKGSKGLSDLLQMEAIQAFENRKSRARQKGEEAGTKLLMPMMGMLAVVLIVVMIPAFLTMQL